MNVEVKLATFSKIIEEEAELRRKAALDEIDIKLNTSIEQFKEQAVAEAKAKTAVENEAALQLVNREISLYSADKKKLLFAKRIELEAKLFSDIEKKILSYTNTDEYGRNLVKNIENEMQLHNCEIIVTKRDYERFFSNNESGSVISAGNDFFIGGYKAVLKNKGMVIDNTYRTRLEDQKENFKGLRAYI